MAVSVLAGCFRDLGNYEYTDVNEVTISDEGFEEIYDVRRESDRLVISPEMTFSEDGADSDSRYSYEWVAVGQHFYRGERFVIGTGKKLDYRVALPAEEYILYFKVKDLETDIVFSRDVPLHVRSTNTLGWILGGEDEDGNGQVDMISVSSDTLYLRNALRLDDGLQLGPVENVWIDNDEWTSEDRLYVSSATGAYKFDRSEFAGSPYTSLRYSYAFYDETSPYRMTDSQKVSDKRHVIIVDSKAYIVSSDGGMIGNSFCTYDNVTEFEVADRMICNHTDIQGIRTFMFYDRTNRRFCYISGLTVREMKTMGDAEGDLWSWDTKNDFPEGLEMVTAVNSFFGDGQAMAVMRDPRDGGMWIYCMTAPRSGTPVKNSRVMVDESVAPGFSSAAGYVLTARHGYVLFASGTSLYGYDFRKSVQQCTLLHDFGVPVTCIKGDIETGEKYGDVFYVATYDDARERSGVVYKYKVEDDPDRVAVRRLATVDEGFLKVRTMCYKAF